MIAELKAESNVGSNDWTTLDNLDRNYSVESDSSRSCLALALVEVEDEPKILYF